MLKLNFAKLSNRIALCYRMMQSPELKKANFNIKQADILNIPKKFVYLCATHLCVNYPQAHTSVRTIIHKLTHSK